MAVTVGLALELSIAENSLDDYKEKTNTRTYVYV